MYSFAELRDTDLSECLTYDPNVTIWSKLQSGYLTHNGHVNIRIQTSMTRSLLDGPCTLCQ